MNAESNRGLGSNEASIYYVRSPFVGTFFRSSSPTTKALVAVGDHVTEDQTVCIVEAMKLMNDVSAEFAGVVEEILADDGAPVEFGQGLIKIRTSS